MSGLGSGRRVLGFIVLLTCGFALAACPEDKTPAPVTALTDAGGPDETATTAAPDAGPGTPAVLNPPGNPIPTPTTTPTTTPVVDASTPTSTTTSPVGTAGNAAMASGDAVFFVGNSFFDSWDRKLPDWVSAIGKVMTPPVDIKTGSYIVPGNQKLSWFLQQPDTQKAFLSRKYKVFVLQPEEREPVDDTANFKQAVRNWNKAIVATGAKTMLFMTWDLSAEKGTTFFKRLSTAFDEIGTELGIPVIPVGLIYDDCNKDPFPGQTAGSYWLTGGELHQTETGSAVNAYATFGMLTGVNPNGSPINAPANTNSPAMLKYLSDKSWLRVEPRLKK